MTFHNGIKMGTIGTESPYPGPYFGPGDGTLGPGTTPPVPIPPMSTKRLNEKKPGREKVAMPNKASANVGKFSSGKSAGQFGDAITRILTMAQEHAIRALDVSTPVQANAVLRDATTLDSRMHDEVFRVLGVRYQLPEIVR